MTFEKGAADASRANAYGATNIDSTKDAVNVIKDKTPAKKHWWQR